jgi:magnesium-transporting ATPase (P-type)
MWILIGAIVAAVVWLLRRRRRRLLERPRVDEIPARLEPPSRLPRVPVRGLSQEEAEARRVEGISNDIQLEPPRTSSDIWRENVLSIFNLNLVGLAIAVWIFGKPFDALVTVGVLLLNIGLNVGQELLAKRRLDELLVLTRLKGAVIREGKLRFVDPDEVVVGDAMVVGPGDYVLVDGEVLGDGQITVDESLLSGEAGSLTKRAGDTVYAGSYCVTGRAAYEAKKIGAERLVATLASEAKGATRQLTELQRLTDLILRVLLALVAGFVILVLAEYYLFRSAFLDETYLNVLSVIFGIAPAGLFFGVVVGYAVGARDMARRGALIHRSRAVESLAYVNVLCFGRTGTLTGTGVHLDYIDPPPDREGLEEDRIQRILADYVYSTAATSSPIYRALSDAMAGNRRPVLDEAPFLSLYGWSAIGFDDVDLHGTYVLGDPDTLRQNLVVDITAPQPETGPGEEGEETPKSSIWKRLRSRAGGILRRSEKVSENGVTSDGIDDQSSLVADDRREAGGSQVADEEQQATNSITSGEETRQPSAFRRLFNRAQRLVGRSPEPSEEDKAKETATEQLVLVFAYRPDVTPLQDGGGRARLPVDLVPLCFVRLSEEIRPEARETVKAFTEAGVDVKILSSDHPDTVATTALALGLGEDEEMPLRAVSGRDLDPVAESKFVRTVEQTTVFGDLTPQLKGEVVRALRGRGRYVAMVGSGADDVSTLMQADLAVAMQGGSQAALGGADIVLLEDSLEGLGGVLRGGERIVNGTLNILKLNLTQITYIVLVLVAISALNIGLIYHPSQASIIALATLTVPAVALSFWAPAKALPEGGLAASLARFVLPAAATTTVAALVVSLVFQTRTQDVAYAQVAVTYTLTACGLVLFVFVQPPTRAWMFGQATTFDRRPAFVAAVLMVLFLLLAPTRLAEMFFKLTALREPTHYLFVGVVVVVWAVALLLIWRTRLMERYLNIDFDQLRGV